VPGCRSRYVIDGSNLLGSWGGPQPGSDRRREVVARVGQFCETHAVDATLVFDGRPFEPVPAQPRLRLLFPVPGGDADTVIRALVDGASRPALLRVVTSDKALYSYARTRGAAIMRAHEWNAAARSLP